MVLLITTLGALVGCADWWDNYEDYDGDGVSVSQGDCDDANLDINPSVVEIWYDGVDQNCDGNDGDQDGDGVDAFEVGGGDCWDDPGRVPDEFRVITGLGWSQPVASEVYEGAIEIWYDGVDQNCDTMSDFDQDADTFDTMFHQNRAGEFGDDCIDGSELDDSNEAGLDPADVNPDESELFYDGTDADCQDTDEWGDYDADGDGYPSGLYGEWDGVDEDCDDADADRFPDSSIEEIWYDGIDQDCDGNDGDQDKDGWVDQVYSEVIEGWDSALFFAHGDAGDCWDGGIDLNFLTLNGFSTVLPGMVYPGAEDRLYDGVDQDCDGGLEFDGDLDGYNTSQYADADGIFGDDCEDDDPLVHPAQDETCATDGIDDNCDGNTNEVDAIDCIFYYRDSDNDGYGTEESLCLCSAAGNIRATVDGDCDDSDNSANPGATEVCNDKDDNCDAVIDEDSATDVITWYVDNDSDGFGDATVSDIDCDQPLGWVMDSTDCDDANPVAYPNADEYCDGVDTDCDSVVDEDDALDVLTWYSDVDLDGYGDPLVSNVTCYIAAGWVLDATDCDDTAVSINPGADEYCDGVDDDCDGDIDEDSAVDASVWYSDSDSDGFGDSSVSLTTCYISQGWVADSTDCDDAAPLTYPGADEYCDGVDTDCDLTVDEDDALDAPTWYSDADLDGYGDPFVSNVTCYISTGWVANDNDCNDTDATLNEDDLDSDGYSTCDGDCDDTIDTVYPNATEYCNALDDDCDSWTDESDAADAGTWHDDLDGDSYGDPATGQQSCPPLTGTVLNNTDCDDNDASVNPGISELDNSLDDDCDGMVDELFRVHGDISLSELMIDPNGSSPADQWFEIYNPGTTDLYLDGLFVSSTCWSDGFFIGEDGLVVGAADYAVVCHSGTHSTATHPAGCDYFYGSDVNNISLAGVTFSADFCLNTTDTLTLSLGGVTLDEVAWEDGVNGWLSVVSGTSMVVDSLYQTATDNDLGASWCYPGSSEVFDVNQSNTGNPLYAAPTCNGVFPNSN